jgi:hypothetical protein
MIMTFGVVPLVATHLFALHVCPEAHVPHASVPPQPSGTDPHVSPSTAHVVGMQEVTHLFALHVCPAAHVPHASVPPQPSGTDPHVSPSTAHVVGVHPIVAAGLSVETTMFQSVALPNDLDADWPAVEVAILSSSPVASAFALERSVKPEPAAIDETTLPTLVAAYTSSFRIASAPVGPIDAVVPFPCPTLTWSTGETGSAPEYSAIVPWMYADPDAPTVIFRSPAALLAL